MLKGQGSAKRIRVGGGQNNGNEGNQLICQTWPIAKEYVVTFDVVIVFRFVVYTMHRN